MKRLKNTIQQTKILLVAALLSMISVAAFAQGPPPPPGGDPTSNQGDKLGGNAHIGGGMIILLTLGLAYGGKRLYDLKKEAKEEVA